MMTLVLSLFKADSVTKKCGGKQSIIYPYGT